MNNTLKGFTRDEILQQVSYDPETGDIQSLKTGTIYGQKCRSTSNTYIRAFVKDLDGNLVHILAHRLAYFLHYGTLDDNMLIDHIDGDKRSNRITNLRQTDCSGNSRNSIRYSNNSTGENNISWNEASQKYSVRYGAFGNQYFVNKFFYVNKKRTQEEAFELAVQYRDIAQAELVKMGIFTARHGKELKAA
jgi:hypothetical protein